MTRHLGGALTAFVDGELDHGHREEVLVHLSHCAACRFEVDVLRGLKATLRFDSPVPAPDQLLGRLLAVTAPVGQPAVVPRPHAPRRRALDGHQRLRRTAFGFGVLALGLGGAFAAAGPPPPQPQAPMDPTSMGFVLEHVSTANEVPFAGVVPIADPRPAR